MHSHTYNIILHNIKINLHISLYVYSYTLFLVITIKLKKLIKKIKKFWVPGSRGPGVPGSWGPGVLGPWVPGSWGPGPGVLGSRLSGMPLKSAMLTSKNEMFFAELFFHYRAVQDRAESFYRDNVF